MPVIEGARGRFRLKGFNWRLDWPGGPEVSRGRVAVGCWKVGASGGEEGLPFRNYELLNQSLEISRFPKTAAQGI